MDRANTSLGLAGSVVVVAVVALAAAIAAWMVRQLSPEATGSGIPYVETQLREGWIGNPLRIVFVKFIGGLMAIGGGLALGREGPTVQIGAVIGHLLGGVFRRNDNDRRVLLAAGAGAGLATAFNAPIAGAIFVLEELVGQFDVPSPSPPWGRRPGQSPSRGSILGQAPDFSVPNMAHVNVGNLAAHLSLGLVFGILGIVYSRAILAFISFNIISAKLPWSGGPPPSEVLSAWLAGSRRK